MRAKEIKQLVEIVEKSTITELEVSRWGRKVRIRKYSSDGSAVPNFSYPPPGPYVVPAVPPAPIQIAEKPEAKPAPVPVVETVMPARKPENEKITQIKAPMVGTFYGSPAPDSDPYVKENDAISPGKVLCIIEAMKLMNEIESEVSGKIIEILVQNGQPVEYNQPLFRVELS